MKKTFRFFSLVAVAAATMCLVACKDDEGVNQDDANANAYYVVEQFVDHTVAPTYMGLASAAEQLCDKLTAMKNSRSQADVDAACALFLEARAWWEKSEAFLFGAATDFGIDPHIDSWPLDLDAFTTLMNSPSVLERLDDEDGDLVAGEDLGNSRLGFHGIEYILFRNGQNRTASEITDDEMVYAIAVSGDLRNRCMQLEVSWLGDAAPAAHVALFDEEADGRLADFNVTVAGGTLSYGANMKKAGEAGSTYPSRVSALMAIVDGCKTIADEVGTSKIGKAHEGEDVTYIESPYSQKSIVDFHDNIVSIQNAYMGGVEGQRNESKSLHNYVKALDASLDSRVIAAIATAIEKIDAMKAPFVTNYTDSSCDAAMEACAALDAVLSEVNDLLRNN